MAQRQRRNSGIGLVGLGLLLAFCSAKSLYEVISVPVLVFLALMIVLVGLLRPWLGGDSPRTAFFKRRAVGGDARKATPRLRRREIAAMVRTAEAKRRLEEAVRRELQELDRVEALAQRYNLPNPTVDKYDVEEAERLRKVLEIWHE